MTEKPKELDKAQDPSDKSVKDCMTRHPEYISPRATIREAAEKMADFNTGSFPVGDGKKLLGFVTDRDIAVRAVAEGLNPETTVDKIMSKDVLYCFENNEIGAVADNMKDNKVLRLIVLDEDKNFVGIVTHSQISKVAVEERSPSLCKKVAELACYDKVA